MKHIGEDDWTHSDVKQWNISQPEEEEEAEKQRWWWGNCSVDHVCFPWQCRIIVA